MSDSWCILRVDSSLEKQVADLFESETYVPMEVLEYQSRRNRVWVRREKPFYPGYVFVRSENPQQPEKPSSRYIRGYMKAKPGALVELPSHIISGLRGFETWYNAEAKRPPVVAPVVETPQRERRKVGDTILINSGHLAGHRATIQSLAGETGLNLEMVNGTIRVTIEETQVELVA